jgi:hypothetical protein
MSKIIFWLFLVTIPTVSALTMAAEVQVTPCDVGEVYSFHAAECNIAFANTGNNSEVVENIAPTTAGGLIYPVRLVIPAHTTKYVTAKIDTGNSVGSKVFRFRYKLNDDASAHEIKVQAFVLNVLDEVRPELDFGVVDLLSKSSSREKSIQLSTKEVEHFRINRVLEAPKWIDVHLSGDRQGIRAVVKKNAPLGILSGYVKLGINTPRQSEAWVLVKANVHGDVVPDANPLDMGLMRFGNKNEYLIRLVSRSGRSIDIKNVSLSGFVGEVAALPCVPAESFCRMVKLSVSDQQGAGAVKGDISVEIPGVRGRVSITVWGLLFPENVKFDTFDGKSEGDPKKGGDGASNAAQSAKEGASPKIGEAIQKAIDESSRNELPPPAGDGPLLKWAIANGSSLYGFQIYRADKKSGPYVLLNYSPIRAIQADDNIKYQWRDEAATPGRTYWYYIGTVDMSGQKKNLTEQHEVVATKR